jgi:hypothetical protein
VRQKVEERWEKRRDNRQQGKVGGGGESRKERRDRMTNDDS